MQMNAGHPPVTIHDLCPQDRDAWGALWHGYLDFYQTELPPETFDRTFARLLDPAKDRMHGFIAKLEGQAVGLVHCIIHDHCWTSAPVCYLQDLFAAPAHRGTGIGRALIEHVYAFADRQGLANVYWLTQEFNQAGRRLYDRVGELTPFIKYQRA